MEPKRNTAKVALSLMVGLETNPARLLWSSSWLPWVLLGLNRERLGNPLRRMAFMFLVDE